MRILFSLLFLFSIGAHGQSTRFFISAHQDDWQLFMNPNVYNSIKNPQDKTVIIHTTAGDAGEGKGKRSYYKAREEGSLRALRFLANTFESGEGFGTEMNEEMVQINGHKMQRMSYRNCVVYLLRLPDGNGQGTGYPLHREKSLKKLYEGTVENLHSIDSTAVYKDKKDIITSLKALIQKEQHGIKTELHLADTDPENNPNDHSDHQTSSKLFQEVAQEIGNMRLFLYVNYFSSEKPKNISEDEFLMCAATWGVTTSALGDLEHYSTWDNVHNAWIGRQYFRTLDLN